MVDDVVVVQAIQRFAKSLAHVGVQVALDAALRIRPFDMVLGHRYIHLEGCGDMAVGVVPLAVRRVERLGRGKEPHQLLWWQAGIGLVRIDVGHVLVVQLSRV